MNTPDTSNGRSVTIRIPRLSWPFARPSMPGPDLGRFGRGKWLVVLMTLALILVVGDGFLYRSAQHGEARATARSEAMAAATARLPAMLSYSYKTLDADLAVASGNATGSFRKEYTTILQEVVAPNAAKKKISTRAEVTGASVVSGDKESVVVLVFLTQTTTIGTAKKPTVSGSRIDVRMSKTADGWFVSKITPV